MSEGVVLNPTRLVLAALIGLVILLVLIIKFNVQAMIAILIGAICIGLLAGMPTQDIISAVNDGIGNTLKGIALLVGLGSMFGAILEVSGGAQTIAVTMVKKFGDEKAAWALGITGLVIAKIPQKIPTKMTQPRSTFNIVATRTGPGVGGMNACPTASPARSGIT